MLDRSVRWRIGNGKSIRLWKDAWLGGNGLGKIISPPSRLPPDASVNELIDPVQRCLKLTTLQENFIPIDIDRILVIPLSNAPKEDERVWHGNN